MLMFIGILYLFLTFAACFILVHLIRFAYIGIKSIRKKPDPPAEKKTEPAPKTQPVYYIVEKKRAKKSSYSEPKEIEFKK